MKGVATNGPPGASALYFSEVIVRASTSSMAWWMTGWNMGIEKPRGKDAVAAEGGDRAGGGGRASSDIKLTASTTDSGLSMVAKPSVELMDSAHGFI